MCHSKLFCPFNREYKEDPQTEFLKPWHFKVLSQETNRYGERGRELLQPCETLDFICCLTWKSKKKQKHICKLILLTKNTQNQHNKAITVTSYNCFLSWFFHYVGLFILLKLLFTHCSFFSNSSSFLNTRRLFYAFVWFAVKWKHAKQFVFPHWSWISNEQQKD